MIGPWIEPRLSVSRRPRRFAGSSPGRYVDPRSRPRLRGDGGAVGRPRYRRRRGVAATVQAFARRRRPAGPAALATALVAAYLTGPAVLLTLLIEIPHFVMERKMLLGIKRRAERAFVGTVG
jgi:hypothetical protein